MSGFADLVERATPALIGGGCSLRITEGRDLSRTFNAVDSAGLAVDLTSATGDCEVLDEGGNPILELTFTGTSTGFKLTASASGLAGLANGLTERKCSWKLSITMGGQTLQAWSANNSLFDVWGA